MVKLIGSIHDHPWHLGFRSMNDVFKQALFAIDMQRLYKRTRSIYSSDIIESKIVGDFKIFKIQ